MTEDEVIDIGFTLVKQYRVPHIFLWLAEEGWQGGYEISVRRPDPAVKKVEVTALPWHDLILAVPVNPN